MGVYLVGDMNRGVSTPGLFIKVLESKKEDHPVPLERTVLKAPASWPMWQAVSGDPPGECPRCQGEIASGGMVWYRG